ncbi:trypsin-like peptidase domain-containing protein [Candidatus Pelagibacter sp.]|nr:trypsin-like peptidase domain-containing protein [Candidatus Pelagibacter sp.]
MANLFKRYLSLFLSLIILLNFNPVNAANFNDDLREIRAEINRDNLQEAIKRIKKIKISNENEQEKIDLLFGDIYLKINQIDKAEEFYQKTFFTSNEEIEARTFIGLAEVRLAQGKLSDAIKYAEQSIQINANKIRPKIILAIAKTRIGEGEESIKILNELYDNRKDAEVALAISDYYSSFDDSKQAINILEEFIKRDPNNIKVLDQLASLHLFDGNKKKAIEYKLIVYKYYEFNRNRNKQKQAKAWILSIDPKYFDKPVKVKKEDKKEQEEYQEDEISNYDDNKVTPNYEEFAFAPSGHGSGFVVGNGKYVITNHHVIDGAKKVAVRNGIGKVTEATVAAISKDYDLAILELSNPYPKSYSIDAKDFVTPKAGDDVISIGYPGIGITYEQPTITQGIISKVFDDEMGIFLTTAAINSGNSGGPLFNLNGKLVGVSFAALDKKKWLDEMGQIPTDMGYAIKSNMIKEVFKHDKSVPVKSAKYDKATIYEKMLPSIALVVVLLDD